MTLITETKARLTATTPKPSREVALTDIDAELDRQRRSLRAMADRLARGQTVRAGDIADAGRKLSAAMVALEGLEY
jgi:hypothetical protein